MVVWHVLFLPSGDSIKSATQEKAGEAHNIKGIIGCTKYLIPNISPSLTMNITND